MKKGFYISLIMFLFWNILHSEQNIYSIGPWKIHDIQGSLLFESGYRMQEGTLKNGFYNKSETYLLRGSLKSNVNTYIWHPGFLQLNMDLIFNPDFHKDNYLVTPDKTESTNEERINLFAYILNQKPFNMTVFFNKGLTYTMRDFGSSIRTNTIGYGGAFNAINLILPININFSKTRSIESELLSGRYYKYDRLNLLAQTSKVLFGKLDNKLSASYDDVNSDNAGLSILKNQITELRSDNSFLFNLGEQNAITSNFSYYDQKGNIKQNQFLENIHFRYNLPENFILNCNYIFNQVKNDSIGSLRHVAEGKLENLLYLSLHSYGYYQYFNAEQFSSKEHRHLVGAGFNYNKLIPYGKLFIDYEFRYDKNSREMANSDNVIRNEEVTLDDTKDILLKFPLVRESSIIVKDKSLSVIYQKNLDYSIVRHGDFFEIRRIPGGLIPKSATVLVDYISVNPTNYNYVMNAHNLAVKLQFFDRFVEIYSRFYINQFNNVTTTTNNVINPIDQKTFGLQLSYNSFNGGLEFESYQSSIMPYSSGRLFLKYSDNLMSNMVLSLTTNYQDYYYTETKEENRMLDLSSRLAYRLGGRTSINFEGSYVNQTVRDIYMGYVNIKAEYTMNISQIELTAGFDSFNRLMDKEKINWTSIYFKVERRF